jgi:rhodanese-related sulfurtransferase
MPDMIKKIIFGTLVLCMLAGVLGAIVGIKIYRKVEEKKPSITKEYYDSENKVAVSPATLRKMIDEKDSSFILIDLRSKEEFNAEHIIGAINIPAVTMNEDEIILAFKKLPPEKTAIVHCYSAYCMLGKQVGQVLANQGIEVKDLNIGWSEWKYFWNLWNPGEDPKEGLKYLEKGTGNTKVIPGVCTNGKFGC